MGLCPTPQFLFEKNKLQGGTSHDDPIDHYFYETCIADGYRILGMGVATHVNVRYKEMSKTFK